MKRFYFVAPLRLCISALLLAGPIGPLWAQTGVVTNVVGTVPSISGTNTTVFAGNSANFTPGKLWIYNPGGGNPFRVNVYFGLNNSTNRFLLNSYTNSGATATNEAFSLSNTNVQFYLTTEIIATNNVLINFQR